MVPDMSANPIFVAIDTPEVAAARALVAAVAPHVGGVKLGLEFFCAHGPAGIAAVMDGDAPEEPVVDRCRGRKPTGNDMARPRRAAMV